MADNTQTQTPDTTTQTPPVTQTTQAADPNTTTDPNVQKLLDERIAAALSEIKPKLDSAYAARDEALRKVAEFEKKEKEAQLKLLEEQGKIKEAAELRLAEKDAELATLKRQNTELSRDVQIRNALSGLDFRNEAASNMAYKEVIAGLVQNENGQWVHKSGISVKDFIEQFAKSEDNSFLFKPKQSSGTGSTTTSGTPSTGKKSVFEMTQAEVLARAAKGEFGTVPQF